MPDLRYYKIREDALPDGAADKWNQFVEQFEPLAFFDEKFIKDILGIVRYGVLEPVMDERKKAKQNEALDALNIPRPNVVAQTYADGSKPV